ncbi:adenosine deaminase [Nitrincola tapanii]|uniref:Adenine deaminase n=1 Tax=Nitrincola tapanii TaxID=1708751 RepID=A0A5A9VZQ4_9GAMM|nr:adenosine deaminase [Nitrincola tapanii]KAA0873980.1 adenosine deaminase [Nitrincola tapanii]
MSQSLTHLIQQLPKAELHLHLEGSLEPELMFKLARRNQIQLPYADEAALHQAYQFNNLQEFLDLYYQGTSVLNTEEDFYDLTFAYMKRIHADQVIHTEVFFDPQAHLARGVSLETQLRGITHALAEARHQFNISYRLILSFLRHLSEEEALNTLEQALPYLDQIAGVGLDSSERGQPPEKFTRLFARCHALGLKVTIHAGEEGPAEYVWQALKLLNAERIDHGNRALEDAELLIYLAQQGIPLTMCPLSNQKLCVVPELDQHPILQLLEKGLCVTVNSDDPAYFGGYINDNFQALVNHLPVLPHHIYQLCRNSLIASWMDPSEKQQALNQLAHVWEELKHPST